MLDAMRKLSFGMKLSLDGYIAATGDDLGWSVPRKAALSPLERRQIACTRSDCAGGTHTCSLAVSAEPPVGPRASGRRRPRSMASWIEADAPQRRTPR
jgi:hypothetical protein